MSDSKNKRNLRERKQRKQYLEWALAEEDYEGARGFSVADKLKSTRFAQSGMVREMRGSDLTVGYLQQHGFNIPLLIKEKAGLGLQVPSPNFSINDVRMCVGSRRVLDVMDVNTQKNLEMTMKEWQKYYEDPNKKKLLNVISLEFSHTKLENYVQSPKIVRQVDWVDVVWPTKLKNAQIEGTNLIEDMMYPKVQKYCLMSVRNCFTDFHIDFGGTSVWYHILKGSKVFWLIPPTQENLQLYEKWVLSGKQSDIFFGDTVEKCGRVYLTAGNTFFIPTGWIHAVYTPEDSLVFGGNFLHSFGIVKQLKVAQVEDSTKVPQKFRYPFFTEMLWYVLAKYVKTLLNHNHLEEDDEDELDTVQIKGHVHLTRYELFGLKDIVMYLYDLPSHKKNVPELVKDPVALIKDVRTLVERHCKDDPELAVTNVPILTAPLQTMSRHVQHDEYENDFPMNGGDDPEPISIKTEPNSAPYKQPSPNNSSKTGENKAHTAPRRRRTRCKVCEACKRSDCGECSFCLDMIKFGGPGKAKQTCTMRQCLQPMLPVTATCIHCHLDGWRQTPALSTPQAKSHASQEVPSSLMECSICYSISHPECGQKLAPNVKGIPNEDLKNSWICPVCIQAGRNNDYKPRHFRARQKSSEIRRMSNSSDASFLDQKLNIDIPGNNKGILASGSDLEDNKQSIPIISPSIVKHEIKQEPEQNSSKIDASNGRFIKRRKSEDGNSVGSVNQDSFDNNDQNAPRKKSTLRNQLAQQIISSSNKPLKKPQYPVRPVGTSSSIASSSAVLDPACLLPVFKYLPLETLVNCSLVCKQWCTVSVDPVLWKRMDCSQYKLSASLLIAIVRRQPEQLLLDWTILAKRQLNWIITRIPGLRNLSLQGTPVQSVLGLHTCLCPPLQVLDLSFIRGLNDSAIREILSPPKDSRPGLADSKSRLRNLKTLKLSGTDISDIGIRYIIQGLPELKSLDLSSCQRITDCGICQIDGNHTLVELNLSSCKMITEVALDFLANCDALVRLDLRHVPQVSTQNLIKFAAKSKNNLQVHDIKLVDRRKENK
ncbi:jmjC domain-containing histone demethylation protein 1 [Culicoides brevitarsis]|uniref:jmjC domain-containing histone demethylation protein 1 n=1 Tax=Culicoides brevitarsis TaxID=469753 RepID=UPI00307B77C7